MSASQLNHHTKNVHKLKKAKFIDRKVSDKILVSTKAYEYEQLAVISFLYREIVFFFSLAHNHSKPYNDS